MKTIENELKKYTFYKALKFCKNISKKYLQIFCLCDIIYRLPVWEQKYYTHSVQPEQVPALLSWRFSGKLRDGGKTSGGKTNGSSINETVA